MLKVRCSGVPEHFNLPWRLAIEQGLFEKQGIEVQWTDNGAGTGAMCQDLRDGKTDIAVLLTEGAFREIHNGNPSKICSFYVDTPLTWGVHTSANSQLTKTTYGEQLKFAISRISSGSHLMAYLYAQDLGYQLTENSFSIINNLDGARNFLSKDSSALFLWEKFTTKFLVDQQEFNRIDEYPTPWPAFVVVASDHLLENHSTEIDSILRTVQSTALKLVNSPNCITLIAERYGLSQHDAKEWLSSVQWCHETKIDFNTLERVGNALIDLNLIEGPFNFDHLLSETLLCQS